MTNCRQAVSTAIVGAIAVLAVGCSHDSAAPQPSSSSAPTSSVAAAAPDPNYGPGRHTVSFDVNGVPRTAVIVVPTDLSHAVPLVFMFHGHGGSGAAVERQLGIEGLWPDAIVVYPDGVVGHKGLTDPEGVKPGWQTSLGEDGDRDLAFYDALLAAARSNLPVDGDHIYLMGHSNGSAFVSLLLNQRGDDIAATANMSAQPGARLLDTDPVRSMFLSMGMVDPIVPYDLQQRSIPLAEQKLHVDSSRATVSGYLRSEPGPGSLELETYVHPGGHAVPPDVPALVVEFFQRHTRSEG